MKFPNISFLQNKKQYIFLNISHSLFKRNFFKENKQNLVW